ncbi:TonB-dependent receptor [Lutibacter sp. A64]|uniref:TonB-dependent receptor plug domain-containing protein n=1 Tax=Lutibacter sp. A64 TaxID=2918526 RepID=UPI001F0577FC|nr:TonB-dependent receptor [Lutibacter sp. A64]UMB53852.1 TonB-dependent receptor [Lutibacter sp. A64]
MNKHIFIFLILFPFVVFSQKTIKGTILDTNNSPIFGASIYWKNSQTGTNSDEQGNFEIQSIKNNNQLVVSFIGFKTQTISINNLENLKIILIADNQLDEVQIQTNKKSSSRLSYVVKNVINVNKDELLKAACCNLAESFETNPSIDVNYSDALTGTKQIKMLGLTSPYIQIVQENIPNIRGAAQTYGLTFTPGTWVESIQITKGAGSVVNGYESITGQINAELVKPSTDNSVFVNAFGSLNGRLELNTHFNTKVSDKWDTGLYLHGNMRDKKIDDNNDNFLDAPLAKQVNIMNRWQYTDLEKGWVSFINLRYLKDDKTTGEIDFDPDVHKNTTTFWGSEINTERFEASAKIGYVFPELPYKSFGLQVAYSSHNQDSYFGLNEYNINHKSGYANLIYNSIISDTRNKFVTGISTTFDNFDELVLTNNYNRNENSVGAFFEYNYDNLSNLSLSAGIRIDHHNLLETFVTPRLHLKYLPWETGTLRFSAGRGKKSAAIFAENQWLFGTNRTINIINNNGEFYGLNPEVAWNYGTSFTQKFKFLNRNGSITFDYYKTDFSEQIIVDMENPSEISFYNADTNTKANSFQVEVNYSPFIHFNIKTAYKYQDTNNNYISGEKQQPMQPKNRFFTNLFFQTHQNNKGGNWKFDYTYNWVSEQRLPDTSIFTANYQLPEYADAHTSMNAQITKVFSPRFEWYIGGENLSNHRQKTPILGADNPFGANFDSSIVYSSVLGAMYYTGIRFNIE